VARDIVRRVPRTQVWIVDRREQAFEDTSVFASGDPQRAQDPRRLLLDIDAASALRQTAAARYLGLRLTHGTEIDVPLYAFSTALTEGRVARGARRLVRRSAIEGSTIVDDRGTSHIDPVSAAPSRNHFLKSVVPFLRRATAR
jgi:hypothetical protein